MSEVQIGISSGQTKRLLTGGKYCPENILVTAQKVPEEKEVNFYDFDGTLLHSFTIEEARALTELPQVTNPPKDCLKFAGWNWTLEAVQNLTIPMDIGALYTTENGATVLEIELTEYDLEVTIHFSQTAENGTTWDFGDNTATETPAATGQQSISHTYAQPGKYTMLVFSNAGTYTFANGTTGYNAFGMYAQGNYTTTFLTAAHMGKNSKMGQWAFAGCNYLKYITLNPEVTYYNVGTYGLAQCYHLHCVNLPCGSIPTNTCAFIRDSSLQVVTCSNLLTHIMFGAFRYCYSLKRVRVLPGIQLSEGYQFDECRNLQSAPACAGLAGNTKSFGLCFGLKEITFAEGSKAIAANIVDQCVSLQKIVLPSAITSIGASAFNSCVSLKLLVFQAEMPPAVANANAFNGIPADCVVEVPAVSLGIYQEATNYSGIAAQMVGV